jgi:hypothetical protein
LGKEKIAMKFKTTIVLMAVFVALLVFVLFFESKNKGKKESEEKLIDLPSADVEKITLKKEDGTISFKKDDKGEWLITEPLEAKGDSNEVNRLAEDFSSLKMERVVEQEGGDITKYEIPKKELTLWYKNRTQPVKILIGMENPLDNALFAKKEDDKRIVLIPSYLKSLLEKKTFDFRQKDIFTFETADVNRIKLRAKDISWEAQKKEEEWFFQNPVNALAKKSRIEDVLRALAHLKAKEFVSEQKPEEDVTKYGLKDPEYVISLAMPSKNQEVVFLLHKDGDNVYATTSISSKIIAVEGQVLTDIEKKVEDLREKQVIAFNSWEAQKLQIKTGGLALTVTKDKDDRWFIDQAAKGEADKSKIETFLRKIETLEASEFIDSPANLQDYGLAQPQAEVTAWTKENDKEKQYQLLVGTEDKDKKQVVVKNPKLEYLFRVDSSFLAEFPKEPKDWKMEKPEAKKEEKK